MGIGEAGRALYEKIGLKPPASILDLGAQAMSFEGYHKGMARDWLERQGFDYACIDLDRWPGALHIDLNKATASDMGGEQFDLVANHGTGEHVFDQANVFRFMHDVTKQGGYMVHIVPTPSFGMPHGFYFYDETIFKDLAEANNYQIVDMHRQLDPWEIIVVAYKKLHDVAFAVPQQGIYTKSEDIKRERERLTR